MSPAGLSTLSTIVAILIGSGAIGGGTLKAARAIIRRAIAAEQARDTAAAAAKTTAELLTSHQEMLANHETRLQRVEGQLWPTPNGTQQPRPSTPAVPSRQADILARLSSQTR